MFKSFFTNSSGILLSRILGFIRDVLSASILGANIYSDIFFVAFKLPNLFRRIFAEGSFTQVFIPSYSNATYKNEFTYFILTRFFFIILTISIIITLFSPIVTDILAFGFDEQTKKITAPLIAINFYYLDFIFLVTFFAALLQYKNHFAVTAFSTALLNIALIIALLLSQNKDKLTIVYYLSYGVLAGGALQLIAHIVVAKKYNILTQLYIGCKKLKQKYPKKAINNFKSNFLPSIFGNSTAHISAFLDTWLATFLAAGSISYLYYANRLFQLPFALFAMALSIAIFPKISKLINNKEEQQALKIMKKSFWILLTLLSMATTIAIIWSEWIVWLLFERGNFTHEDTIKTSYVLIMYMVGLIPYGINKIFSLWLYSNHMHKKAAKIAAISLGSNIIFSLILVYFLKVYGLALASSLSGIVLLLLTIKQLPKEYQKYIFEIKYFIYFAILIFIFIFINFLIKGLVFN